MGGRGAGSGGASVGAIGGRIGANHAANAAYTPQQTNAVDHYFEDANSGDVTGMYGLNEALSSPGGLASLPAAARARAQERVNQINDAVSVAPRLPERTSIYVSVTDPNLEKIIRSNANDMTKLNNMTAGKNLPLKQVLTGSLKRSDTYGASGLVVKVNVPKNQRAIYHAGTNGQGPSLTLGSAKSGKIVKTTLGNGQVVIEVDLN